MQERDNDRLVAACVAERDASCPACHDNLRGVSTARCPECTMPLDVELLRDGTEAPREQVIMRRDLLRLAALAGVALAGFCLLWLLR